MLRQLFRRQGRTEVGVSLAHDRQRQGANLSRQPMVAGFASALGKQARGIIDKTEQRTRRTAVLKPGMLRAVDLHQLAQAIAPPARLMRRGETMSTVLPQSIPIIQPRKVSREIEQS